MARPTGGNTESRVMVAQELNRYPGSFPLRKEDMLLAAAWSEILPASLYVASEKAFSLEAVVSVSGVDVFFLQPEITKPVIPMISKP